MLHESRVLMVALGLVCTGGASASGADICVAFSGGGIIAGKDFALQNPPVGQENTCKPVNGVELGGLGGAFTGTGCVARDGGSFIFHYSYHNAFPFRVGGGGASYFESGFCRFAFKGSGGAQPLPGSCRGTILTGPPNIQSQYHQPAELSICNVDVPGGVVP